MTGRSTHSTNDEVYASFVRRFRFLDRVFSYGHSFVDELTMKVQSGLMLCWIRIAFYEGQQISFEQILLLKWGRTQKDLGTSLLIVVFHFCFMRVRISPMCVGETFLAREFCYPACLETLCHGIAFTFG